MDDSNLTTNDPQQTASDKQQVTSDTVQQASDTAEAKQVGDMAQTDDVQQNASEGQLVTSVTAQAPADDQQATTVSSVKEQQGGNDIVSAVHDTTKAQAVSKQQADQPIEPLTVSTHKEQAPVSLSNSEPLVKGEGDENGVLKEAGNDAGGVDTQPEAIVQPSHPEVKLAEEVEKAGVEKGPDAGEKKLDKQVEQAGVSLAKESTPVSVDPSSSVKLPMTYAQAVVKKKKSGLWNSVTWFAGEIVYQWKKLKPDVYE